MPAVRKTRQQKIMASQRQGQAPAKPSNHASMADLDGSTTLNPATTLSIQATHAYVYHDLRHIGWIMLVCLVLLAIATLFLADFSWVADLRSTLHIGTFTIH